MLYSKPGSLSRRNSPLSDRAFSLIAFSPQSCRHIIAVATPVIEAASQSVFGYRWLLFLGWPWP
jgi:hypothetical protein